MPRQVQVIRGVAPVGAGPFIPLGDPMVVEGIGMQKLAAMINPKFSGEARDWVSFVKEWEEYVDLMAESSHNSVSDNLKLSALKECLDDYSRAHLIYKKETNKSR